MKKSLLFIFIWMVKVSAAQYCGSSGPDICTAGGLSAPGITDYNTFPCVHNSVPYSETIQIYFPTDYLYSNYDIAADSIAIDSITNLPCGLCWQCNSPTFIYTGGSQACIKISGTANELPGAYQLSIYGRVFTPFGVIPGTLDNIGLQFFMNVVGQNDTCTPINVQGLHIACAAPVTDTVCNFSVMLGTAPPVSGCQFDSTTLVVTQPTGSAYQYQFLILGDNNFRIDSGAAATIYNTDIYASAAVTDSNGCTVGSAIDMLPTAGPVHAPVICYATADSSAASSNSLTLVFERDDWFNNVTAYSIYRQDDGNGTMSLIGSIPANEPGYVTDTMPLTLSYIDSVYEQGGTGANTYSLTCQTACNDSLNSNTYFPFILGVDTNPVGYPSVFWTNSSPINYNEVSVFSRYPGGNWRLRYATGNLITGSSWIDFEPDSVRMQYMAALSLTVDCDPDRAVSHTAFSNFGSIGINSSLVTNAATGLPAVAGTGSVNAVLYPNPTGDKLFLEINNAPPNATLNFKVYDMPGRTVLTQTFGAAPTQIIDVAGLAPGVYMLSLYNAAQQVAVKKFLKN